MLITIAIIGLALTVLAWFLFKDTMNRIQYIESLRIYWITRDIGTPGEPHFAKGFMRQTADPFWRGKGIQVRIGKYVFQVGRLTMRVDSLASQIGRGFQDYSPKTIRKWD